MLVNRQQEIAYYPEPQRVKTTVAVASQRPDTSLKRNYLLFILLVIVAAMLITVQSQITVQAGYNLVQLKAQTAVLEKQNELLCLDIAKLSNPERIQQIASRDLGMIVPPTTYYAAGTRSAASQPEVAQGNQSQDGISIINTAEASSKD